MPNPKNHTDPDVVECENCGNSTHMDVVVETIEWNKSPRETLCMNCGTY